MNNKQFKIELIKLGITQKQFADLAGLSAGYVMNMASGFVPVSDRVVMELEKLKKFPL